MHGSMRAALLIVSTLVLAACSAVIEVGDLQVTITGVPSGASASIVVTGPGGFNRVVTESGELTGLRTGTYTLTPAEVTAPNSGYVGVERFGAAEESVAVTANASTPVTVNYTYQGLSVDDVEGDAAGNANNYPIFDAVNLRSEVDGDAVTFTVTLTDAATDLTTFVAVIDLDVDQDATTGEPAFGGSLCPQAGGFGSEFRIFADLEFTILVNTANDTEVDLALPLVDGTSVSITVPKSQLLNDDGRVSAVASIANFDEPTDCLP